MDDDFKNIDVAMPELIKDFEGIENSATTTEQAINEFSKCIQRRLGLYTVIVTKIDGDKEIFQSVFSSDETYDERLSKHPPAAQKVSSNSALSHLVSNGQIMVSTSTSQKDFSPLLMETASDVWLPVKKKDIVIGIIKLGSRKIIHFDNRVNSDDSKSFFAPYENLLKRISQILEKTFENK